MLLLMSLSKLLRFLSLTHTHTKTCCPACLWAMWLYLSALSASGPVDGSVRIH